jgi:hypothetical protein
MLGMKSKTKKAATGKRAELRRQLDAAYQAATDSEALRLEIQQDENFPSPHMVSSLVVANKLAMQQRPIELREKYERLHTLEMESIEAARCERDLRATAPQRIMDELAGINEQRREIEAERQRLIGQRDFHHAQLQRVGRDGADRLKTGEQLDGELAAWQRGLDDIQRKLTDCDERAGALTEQSNRLGVRALEVDPQE